MNEPLSYIEISRSNLIWNIKSLRKFLGSKKKIAAVIKANAYGHGQNEVAKIIEPYVDYFQVDDFQELESLRKITKKPILVFGYVQKKEIEKVLELNGIIGVYDIERLKLANKIAAKLKIVSKVHIKIDANLGRQGILLDNLEDFLKEIKTMKNIAIDGVYSHFANIEDTKDNSHALKQIDTFSKASKLFEKHGFGNFQKHISATSGVLMYEKNNFENQIVRIGIGLYGMWPSKELERKFKNNLTLKPVLRWVTRVAQVKNVPKNYTIGYGLTYKTKKPMKVAVIPQGYSDGYDRGLSGCGEVLISGKKCRVLGRVAMNMFVVDVDNIKNVKAEDEVVLLGSQKKETITAEEIAKKLNTINYEITTRISPLLPRIVR